VLHSVTNQVRAFVQVGDWASHTLPVIAVIHDPERGRAVWSDITDLLRSAPTVVSQGPFSVTCPETQELSNATFGQFRDYCLRYREQYSREPNFGRALASFADRGNIERCFDGLRALFAYHRQQTATWYYLISCLANYREHPVLPALIVRLCHVPGHGDIFWHKGNLVPDEARRFALAFMRERFGRPEVLTMLTAIREDGIQRGSLGQCVHALVDVVDNVESILESIAVDRAQSERVIHSAIILAASVAQWKSPEIALAILDRIGPTLDDEDMLGTVAWLRRDLTESGAIYLC
jgi:hypothetical protein